MLFPSPTRVPMDSRRKKTDHSMRHYSASPEAVGTFGNGEGQ
jgi:hypothetical protein